MNSITATAVGFERRGIFWCAGVKDISHLPPGFSVVLDPEPPASAGNSPEPAGAKRRTAADAGATAAQGADRGAGKGRGAAAGKTEDSVEEKPAGGRGGGRTKGRGARGRATGKGSKGRGAGDEWGSDEGTAEGLTDVPFTAAVAAWLKLFIRFGEGIGACWNL